MITEIAIQPTGSGSLSLYEEQLTRVFFLMGLGGAFIGFKSGGVSLMTDFTGIILLIIGIFLCISWQTMIPMLAICSGIIFSPVTAHYGYAMSFLGLGAALIISSKIEQEYPPVDSYYSVYRFIFLVFVFTWVILAIQEISIDFNFFRSLHIIATNICNFTLFPALLLMVINRIKIQPETCRYGAILVACTGILMIVTVPHVGSPLLILDDVSGVSMRYKVFGTTLNVSRAAVGGFLAIVLSPLPFLLLVEEKRITGIVLAIVTVAGVTKLLFSGARGGMIVFSLTQIIGLLMVNLLKIRIHTGKLVILALICVIGATYFVGQEDMYRWDKFIMDRWSSLGTGQFSWSQDRPRTWRIGFNYLIEAPLGVGWEKMYYLQKKSATFHNDFLVIGVAQGVMALVAYASLVILSIMKGLNLARSGESNTRRMSGLAGMLAALAFFMSSFFDHQTADMIRFQCSWFVVALLTMGSAKNPI